MTRTANTYNATAFKYDADGNLVSREAVQCVDGRIMRASGHWSPMNGTADYQSIWLSGRMSFMAKIEIRAVDFASALRDAGCAGRARLLATF